MLPTDFDFWDEQRKRAWLRTFPLMIDLLFAGVVNGVAKLPAGVRVLVKWDVVNQSVIDWLDDWRGGMFFKMNETTQKHTIKAIQDWMREGEPMDALVKRLEPWFGKERAERIAVTEVTRAYSEGNRQAWMSTGYVKQERWMTAMDDRVCPICAPLHGMVAEINSNGFTTEAGGLGLNGPPAHIRCRCETQPVVDLEAARERTRQILDEVP